MTGECYCGACGKPCVPIFKNSCFLDDAYGATKTCTVLEVTTDCCGDDHFFRDPELTDEIDDYELVEYDSRPTA